MESAAGHCVEDAKTEREAKATLYVVATPIGNLKDVTLRALDVLREVDAIAAEDTRITARLLTHYGIATRKVFALHEHNEQRTAPRVVEMLDSGRSIALTTDAGTPAFSDPGARLVAAVRAAGHPVVPIPGPNAVAAALSASGLPGPQFLFYGFLPAKAGERHKVLEELRASPYMDPTTGQTAAQWLANASESEIREVIRTYGEERFAKQIAASIVAARQGGPLRTTGQLAALVAEAVPTREPRQDPATRTFQAVRIHVNQELEELSLVLPQCIALLEGGGRLVVISFHSLEDRIVKRFIRDSSRADTLPPGLAVRARDLPEPKLRPVGKARRPSAAEVDRNPRARSAIMRVAERTFASA